jgi:hypothetical protein
VRVRLCRARLSLLAALTAAVFTASCLQVTWVRLRYEEAPPAAALERLEAGNADLTQCFEALGAPVDVWDLGDGRVALAWAFDDTWAWNVSVSAAVERSAPSASLRYGERWADVPSVVVLIDGEGRVLELRRGRLADVAPQRRRPGPVEEAD